MMHTRSRRVTHVWLVSVLLITVEVGPPVAAQAPILPYATLRVVPQTTGEVWPGDFNKDGITDLASGGDEGDAFPTNEFVQIALGNGDGTFRAPIVSATGGMVRAVGDMNRDGALDVVAVGGRPDGVARQRQRDIAAIPHRDGPVAIPGHRTGGRLQRRRPPRHRRTAVHRRLVPSGHLPGTRRLHLRCPVLLPSSPLTTQATAGDFDGDGRLDLAVAENSIAGTPGKLTIFLNSGLFQFTPATVVVPKGATDLTTRDLNGDGALDLVVSGSTYSGFDYAHDGFVYVFIGDGTGAFTLAGTYATAIGPIAIVVGDFTRDGRLDVATANRSFRVIEDSCAFMRPADSVSIIPGRGDGGFGEATTFALGSQAFGAEIFGNDVDSLNTGDLNRDGHTDLIVSEGRVLLAAAPRANRAPVVDAGDDETSEGGSTIFLRGGATDPDGHLLSFRVTDASGLIDYASSFGCIDNLPAERYDLTMTASDGRAQASDTVVFDFRFRDTAPAGWTNGDIGQVAAAGSSLFNPREDQFTVTGSGADIWNRADEFHFVRTSVQGDFSFYATVNSVENVDVWTKAGLMIRESEAPGARHASVFVTPTTTKGIAFQRRTTANGLSVHTAGPAMTGPVLLLLKRTGDLISAYHRPAVPDGTPWTLIGRDVLPGLANTVSVGLAVTSHDDGTVATARFGGVAISGPGAVMSADDVGAVGVPGTGNFTATSGEIEGSGADIWGTADAFYFFRQWWTADATITMRVQSLEHTHRWAKLGPMFRESAAPGARHVMLVVSAGAGLAMQYRAEPGGISSNVALTPGTAPEWLRLRRSGNTFTGAASEDGVTWRTVGVGDAAAGSGHVRRRRDHEPRQQHRASGVFSNLSVIR